MALIATAIVGTMTTFAGILAQASGDVEPISIVLTGVGGTTVIGVMAWIVKKVVSGEMVPLPIRTLVENMQTAMAKQDKIIELLLQERPELKELVRSSTEAQFAMHEYLRMATGQVPPLPSQKYSRYPNPKEEK